MQAEIEARSGVFAAMPTESSKLSISTCSASRETRDPMGSKRNEYMLKEDKDHNVRIKNRRKIYLDRHPSYFNGPDLELADPLLYDRCVRRFQSAAEREAEGRAKGFSGVLEADLYRSEAKFKALRGQDYFWGTDGQLLPEDADEIPANKEEGLEKWKHRMLMRFLNGEDSEFPYNEVDQNEELDVIENREAEDRWFEDEEPRWVGKSDASRGETGIQDF